MRESQLTCTSTLPSLIFKAFQLTLMYNQSQGGSPAHWGVFVCQSLESTGCTGWRRRDTHGPLSGKTKPPLREAYQAAREQGYISASSGLMGAKPRTISHLCDNEPLDIIPTIQRHWLAKCGKYKYKILS